MNCLNCIVSLHCHCIACFSDYWLRMSLSLHEIVFSESELMNFLCLAVAWSLSGRERAMRHHEADSGLVLGIRTIKHSHGTFNYNTSESRTRKMAVDRTRKIA